ncbi:uncharacterized protein [Blastocystis hominis]|uniref:Uncharacterized protein n=1 Tax=Blastocystis hominis TaxID=12968 RepID=D8LWT0_BLAHO|nr:uncharacterized protein [Blastocystis hominis]CBK20269.2 unnamed protein product [Blastocystis hominis]|eukprot:XP_012894317.1 uncharacterized protein [Blastocystis hominis]
MSKFTALSVALAIITRGIPSNLTKSVKIQLTDKRIEFGRFKILVHNLLRKLLRRIHTERVTY